MPPIGTLEPVIPVPAPETVTLILLVFDSFKISEICISFVGYKIASALPIIIEDSSLI
jgi:hypothetical protein